jgi:hypothetical protein
MAGATRGDATWIVCYLTPVFGGHRKVLQGKTILEVMTSVVPGLCDEEVVSVLK